MIDLRLWRISLLGVPVALAVAMFSLAEVPPAIESPIAPDAFDGAAAGTAVEQLTATASEPRPGSDADEAMAELVTARFSAIEGAVVSEQSFQSDFGGDRVSLKNVIAVLPGASERQVAVLAARDSAAGSGASTSIAATAALLEIAAGFAGSTHEKTLVFVSTDGASVGAEGARRFARDYSARGLLDAAVVISQPGAASPSQPLVIPWSLDERSTASALTESAREIVTAETGMQPGEESPFDDLMRLALPAALGEQGPLIEQGLDAVRLSSDGELPAPSDGPQDVDIETLDGFGRAALALLLALDAHPGPPEQGPDAYVGLSGNLLPGWTLSLLALSLLAPLVAVSVAGLVASARSPLQGGLGMGWAAAHAIPPLAAAAAVYLSAGVGLIPSPEFPFDPEGERLGIAGGIGLLLALAAFTVAWRVTRPLRRRSRRIGATGPAAALAIAALAGVAVWAINPYLGLLVGLGLQAWVLAAGLGRRGRPAAVVLLLAGLVPVALAVGDLAGRFEAGPPVLYDLLLMFTGGQLGVGLAVAAALLAGSGIAIFALARRRTPRPKVDGRAGEGPGEEVPDQEPASPEAPDQPQAGLDQEEPRDPRLWSKPAGARSRPSRSIIAAPAPSVTLPISVTR